jgi:hypothetical protein
VVFELSKRKLFVILSVLVVLIAVPLTLYLTSRQQETRSHASQEDAVVATVNGVQIHQSDVKKVALESSDSPSADDLATAKNTAIERAILDSVAQDDGITADQSEIDQVASDEGITSTEAKYEILRNNVIAAKVRYVKALSLGYWEPTANQKANYSADDWTNVQKQLADGDKMLTQAEADLKTGDDVVTYSSDLLKSFPTLTDVLAMNGYIFTQVDDSDRNDLAVPALYEYGASNFDPETRDKVFAAANKVGDVVVVSNTSASAGGTAFKITEIGTGTEDSYDSWLAKEKASTVK